jgi:hypothetical protein
MRLAILTADWFILAITTCTEIVTSHSGADMKTTWLCYVYFLVTVSLLASKAHASCPSNYTFAVISDIHIGENADCVRVSHHIHHL